jgi:lipid-A-disaccharide synthase
MMVLFPFEQEIYRQNNIPVKFIGHPLADSVDAEFDQSNIRAGLGIEAHRKIVAFMPGSRDTELAKMLPIHLKTIKLCCDRHPDITFISSVLTQHTADLIEEAISRQNSHIDYKIYINRSEEVLKAANVALLTSGTVTLEALLCGTPMVVGYRVNWLSSLIIRAMVDIDYVSLPNLLAGKALVKEYIQGDCDPTMMATELLSLLEDPEKLEAQRQAFAKIHRSIQHNASDNAAKAVMELI